MLRRPGVGLDERLGLNGAGLIRVARPSGSYLPLSTVISLHRTNPERFAWCDSV